MTDIRVCHFKYFDLKKTLMILFINEGKLLFFFRGEYFFYFVFDNCEYSVEY